MSDPLPQYSIADARDHLTQLVHSVEQGKPIEITRRGKRVAILLSAEDFDRLSAHQGSFGSSLAEFRQRWGIAMLDFNPDEVFQDVRDTALGREVVV